MSGRWGTRDSSAEDIEGLCLIAVRVVEAGEITELERGCRDMRRVELDAMQV